jgi:chaperone modulatory protein CbpM
MTVEYTEVHWLDAHQSLTLAELAELSGLSATELGELVDCGVLRPLDLTAAGPSFGAQCLAAARTAARLRADFDLQPSGLALALTLLERVHDLEAQTRSLQALLPRYRR